MPSIWRYNIRIDIYDKIMTKSRFRRDFLLKATIGSDFQISYIINYIIN
jgi:hypothetical protein